LWQHISTDLGVAGDASSAWAENTIHAITNTNMDNNRGMGLDMTSFWQSHL
jgi:hypothetical protein